MRGKDIPWLAKRLQNQILQWVSPEIENELLDIYAGISVNFITDSVQKTGRFRIIVDESTDVGNRGQMSICLRYVVDGKTSKSFVEFCETDSVTGEALFQEITTKIQQLGLEIEGPISKST